MPRLIPRNLRAPKRRSSSARRRGSYFSLPKRRGGGGGGIVSGALNLGENTNLHKATNLFLMLFLGLALYIGLLIPGINDLECGVDWDSEYNLWLSDDTDYIDKVNTQAVDGDRPGITVYTGLIQLDGDGNGLPDVIDDAGEIPNDDARDAKLIELGIPFCDGSAFPSKPRILGQTLDILVPFLPLFVLIPILFLFFRQVGSIAALPAFLAVLLLREVIPGDGIFDWGVLTLGIVIACIPTPVKGLLSSLSHLGALALWPTVMLAYHASSGEVGGDVPASVLTVLDFLVWVIPFGLLMLIPIRWKMGDNEALV